MKDLTDPFWIQCKGFLFVVAGLLAAGLLLLRHPGWREGGLLVICVWSFCRAYYFAFYVIEHYLDPAYRFSGLGSFAAYWFKKGRSKGGPRPEKIR